VSVPRLRVRDGWILSPTADLAVFAGPVVVAGGLVVAFERTAGLDVGVPPWAFVLLVVGCDVAHVYATAFRTYLDPDERRRRPVLYAGVPLACFAVGAALHLVSAALFWRCLAYLAAFHFVRQQVGWMAYSARRAGETSRFDRLFDRLAVYDATVFPLLWWHANLPRAYQWFVQGDFVPGVPPDVARALLPLHVAVLAAWFARQAWHGLFGRGLNRAKVLVLSTTWLAWFGGIVLFDSDLAFTATNVLAHGVPYLAVVHRFGAARWPAAAGAKAGGAAALFRADGFPLYFALLAAAAFLEEWAWDRFVWHEHGAVFLGPTVALGSVVLSVVVALLAVPQATHYVLDAFLWRTGRHNPALAERLGLSPPAPPASARAREPAASR
jgi:hypothetical protein